MTSDGSAELLIATPAEISAEWLSRVMDSPVVAIDDVSRIGTGQMSRNFRVAYRTAAGPHSVVIKLASDDPASRATGVGMGAYRAEISFYRELAERIGSGVPACHLAVYDETEGWFTLVLEDIVDGQPGDQIRGCTVEEARTALRALAAIHAPVFNDVHVGTWDWLNEPNPLNQTLLTAVFPGFKERFAGVADPDHLALIDQIIPRIDAWEADRRAPLGLMHRDFRLDNLLFHDGGCTVVDWQTLGWGPVMLDAAYFLGGAFAPEVRREHERELVRAYHDELVARGVQNFAWETCWEEYRRQVFWNLTMTVIASMVVEQTERGDEMFAVTIERLCAQIIDLDSVSLLPEPGAKPAPLVPPAADEGMHEPGVEEWWNESFYADAAAADGSLGLYARIGRIPNRAEADFTASIVVAGQPVIMVADHHCALPEVTGVATQTVRTDRFTATQECEEPLETFRFTFAGTGERFADVSAPLRHEPGEDVEVSFDLTWHTDGQPYAWRQSTRYEIPCRVTGTLTVDGQEYAVDLPGQRDHSHGSRDWWANDWMWSAFHLDDGTRTHAVMLPALPGAAIGYVQREDDLTEIESGTITVEDDADGVPVSAQLASEPDGLVLDVTAVGQGAILFEAPDGRVSHFIRTLATVTTPDGRTGSGWIEWNRNQA